MSFLVPVDLKGEEKAQQGQQVTQGWRSFVSEKERKGRQTTVEYQAGNGLKEGSHQLFSL